MKFKSLKEVILIDGREEIESEDHRICFYLLQGLLQTRDKLFDPFCSGWDGIVGECEFRDLRDYAVDGGADDVLVRGAEVFVDPGAGNSCKVSNFFYVDRFRKVYDVLFSDQETSKFEFLFF